MISERLRQFVSFCGKVLAGLFPDLLTLGGLTVAISGIWILSRPVAFIGGGIAMVFLGLASSRRG